MPDVSEKSMPSLNQRAREEAAEQDKIADVCNWNDKENTARKVAQLLRDLADENERLRGEVEKAAEDRPYADGMRSLVTLVDALNDAGFEPSKPRDEALNGFIAAYQRQQSALASRDALLKEAVELLERALRQRYIPSYTLLMGDITAFLERAKEQGCE